MTLINLLKAIHMRLSIRDRYPWDDIESLVFKKKSKEELDREWQEFTKEQEKAFDELLIEKGIKTREKTTKINTLCQI